MAVYSKETALFKNGAIDEALAEAGSKAENFISTVGSNGIFVHTEGSPDAQHPETSGNYGVHISDAVDVVSNGDVVASYGETAVVGRKYDSNGDPYQAYIEVESNKLSINDNTQATVFECEGDISVRTVYVEQTITRQFSTENQTVEIDSDVIKSGGNIRVSVKVSGGSTFKYSFTQGTSQSYFSENFGYIEYDSTTEAIELRPSGNSCRFDQLVYETEEPAPTLKFGRGNYSAKGDTALFGLGLYAYGEGQTIVGRYNKWDRDGEYAFIVGNGEIDPLEPSTTGLSNAFAVGWDGGIVTAKDFLLTDPGDIFDMYSPLDWNISEAKCLRRGHIIQLYVKMTNVNAITVGVTGNITDISVGYLKSGLIPILPTTAHSYGNYAGQQWYYINTAGRIWLTAVEGTGSSRTIDAGTQFEILAVYIID